MAFLSLLEPMVFPSLLWVCLSRVFWLSQLTLGVPSPNNAKTLFFFFFGSLLVSKQKKKQNHLDKKKNLEMFKFNRLKTGKLKRGISVYRPENVQAQMLKSSLRGDIIILVYWRVTARLKLWCPF